MDEEEEGIFMKRLTESLRSGLECPICYNVMLEPAQLFSPVDDDGRTCQHSVCVECCRKVIFAKPNPSCPLCRRKLVSFVENRIARDALRNLRAGGIDIERGGATSGGVQSSDELVKSSATAADVERAKQLERDLEEAHAAMERMRAENDAEKRRIQEELARAQRETEEHIQEMQRLAEQRERENQESREQHARTEALLERYRQEALQLEERIRAETALKEEQFAQLEQDKEKLLQLQTKKYTNVVEDIRLMQAQIAKTQAQLQHTHDRHMALKRLHRNTQQSLKDKEGELEDLRVRASSKEETNPAAGSPMTSLLTSIVHSSATYLWGDADSPLCCRLSDFDLQERRGTSLQSKVWRAIEKETGNVFALKLVDFRAAENLLSETSIVASPSKLLGTVSGTVSVDATASAQEKSDAFREAMLLHRLKHPNILNLHRLCRGTARGTYYMISPFVEFDLEFLMETKPREFTRSVVRGILSQVLKAVAYLHRLRLVHRCLEPSAILMDGLKSNVYLCCLGHTRSLLSEFPLSPIPFSLDCTAPELLFQDSSRQTPENWVGADIWAIGCIFAKLLRLEYNGEIFQGRSRCEVLRSILSIKGCRPVNKDSIRKLSSAVPMLGEMLKEVQPKRSLRSLFPKDIDTKQPYAFQLLSQMLQFEPGMRISASDALLHPYFSNRGKPNRDRSEAVLPRDFSDKEVESWVEGHCKFLL